jgi:UDP-glucose 4-epimerase
MVQRALVTGGAGFIGSHVVDTLIQNGHEVHVLDDLSTGRRENVHSKATLHVADIRDPEAAALVSQTRAEILVHHAAQIDVRRSVADPAFDVEVNILGLINLLEAARVAHVRQVIFASTGGAIYGEQDTFPADEGHPTRPVSPYGAAKLAGEQYLFYYHCQHGLDVTCLRYANVYGPRQNPHGEAGVVAIFLNRLLGNEAPKIHGDGGQTRDYVFVGDVAEVNRQVIGLEGFRVYNVGTGVETDVTELYAMLRDAAGSTLDAHHGPPQPGEQRRSCISPAKLAQELGVRVSTPLRTGIRTTAEWFSQASRS